MNQISRDWGRGKQIDVLTMPVAVVSVAGWTEPACLLAKPKLNRKAWLFDVGTSSSSLITLKMTKLVTAVFCVNVIKVHAFTVATNQYVLRLGL
jgi:hypothetical protein